MTKDSRPVSHRAYYNEKQRIQRSHLYAENRAKELFIISLNACGAGCVCLALVHNYLLRMSAYKQNDKCASICIRSNTIYVCAYYMYAHRKQAIHI